MEVIRSLGRAAEYRDNETGLHIVRMSKFSQHIAMALGMDDEYAELILNASPMHDVGKVGIPNHILLKPGKLTEEEFEVMCTHTLIGVEILSSEYKSDLLDMAKTIALSHHEKWDGTGYPYGLKGEQIPLESRIVAIADVFDALTSERPYKHAWPLSGAVNEIERLSGSHFEPAIVAAFKEVLPHLVEIRGQHMDNFTTTECAEEGGAV